MLLGERKKKQNQSGVPVCSRQDMFIKANHHFPIASALSVTRRSYPCLKSGFVTMSCWPCVGWCFFLHATSWPLGLPEVRRFVSRTIMSPLETHTHTHTLIQLLYPGPNLVINQCIDSVACPFVSSLTSELGICT